MTTANVVMDRALALARAGADEEVAIRDLVECCGENRVAVVMARRRILEQPDPQDEGEAARAAELLDRVIARLSEA